MKKQRISVTNIFLLSLILFIFIPVPARAIDMELGSNPVQLDICNGSISIVSSRDTVTYSQGEHNWTSTGGCIITQSDISTPTSNRITLGGNYDSNSMEIKITIANLNIYSNSSPIALGSKAKATITLVGETILEAPIYLARSNAGILVPEGAELTINGEGALTANGGGYASGIGAGGYEGKYGVIIINGGTVTATGDAAGVGSGYGGDGGDGGTVIINGGVVTASGDSGAGIGAGGWDGHGGDITINGGTVTATSKSGAGIGGARSANKSVTINGGTVVAQGGLGSAGIGGGNGGDGGEITINGGIVTATGGNKAPGIGCGNNAQPGTITITDGTVTASGGAGGAGIGSGNVRYQEKINNTITIAGGTVVATGGENAPGIGTAGGYYIPGVSVTITGGKVTAVGSSVGIGGTNLGGCVAISNAEVTAEGTYHAIGSGVLENSNGCESIDIGENAVLNLSYTHEKGGLFQERITINAQPVDAAALDGNAPLLFVDAYGFSGLTYQWQSYAEPDWTDLEGQTEATGMIPVTEDNEGTPYRCAITNYFGNTIYTDQVTIHRLAFSEQPKSMETDLYTVAALSVATEHSSCVTYQWQRSYDGNAWSDLDGQTKSTLSVAVTHSENGAYYRCAILATNGDALYSEPARITVTSTAVTYSTDYYLENLDGSYTHTKRITTEAAVGSAVSAPEEDFEHYTENTELGVHIGSVTADSSLVLSRYYERSKYTITFETGNGTPIDAITAKHGASVIMPADPSCYGYAFGGWYLDKNCTKQANVVSMPTENTTIYAKWTAIDEGRGIEYQINGISLLDENYSPVTTIPVGDFYAQVSVTNLASKTVDTLILAAYDENGKQLELFFLCADPQMGQNFMFGAFIDNANGNITELRAFMVQLLGGATPLANSVSLKNP